MQVLFSGLCGLLAGALWMASVGHLYLTWQLPANKIQQDVILEGRIDEVSLETDRQTLMLSVYRLDEHHYFWPRKVQLSWYQTSLKVSRHQHAEFRVRLKPPYGTVNPGSGSRQQWMLSKGIVAGGVVSPGQTPQIHSANCIHQRASESIEPYQLNHQRWFKALLLGDRSELTDVDWHLLKITGTAHLFSLSGLHLGVVSISTFYALSLIWLLFRRSTGHFAPDVNLLRIMSVPVLLVSGAYAWLADWQLPVTRAWVLLLMLLACGQFTGHWSVRQRALWMVFITLLIFPLSVYSASFYLSVGAVLLIWMLIWRFRLSAAGWRQRCRSGLILQTGMSLMLIPVTLIWFGQFAWLSLPVNLLCVPLVSLLLPVCLLVLLISFSCPWLDMSWAWGWLERAMAALIGGLEWLAGWSDAAPEFDPGTGIALAGLLGMVVFLLPAMPFRRWTLAACCLPVIGRVLWANPVDWYAHVVDVGQGSAVVISRGRHAVLIDTGRSFHPVGSYAQSTIIPLLHTLNIRRLDWLAISHGDDDHDGGRAEIETFARGSGSRNFRVLTSLDFCQQGWHTHWQGINIQALWPPVDSGQDDNHHSCVLMLDDGSNRLLLPGDIDRAAEYSLLAQKTSLQANVLLAPHHGSNTSSGGAFVRAVSPSHVVFTQGYLNQWDFPANEVVSRYQAVNATLYATGYQGYLKFRFSTHQDIGVQTFRQDLQPRWYQALTNSPGWIEK